MSELEPSAWLGSVTEILDGVGADWAAGAIATNAYREETRLTTDRTCWSRIAPARRGRCPSRWLGCESVRRAW